MNKNIGETYITSDSHFGHKNIIKYCNRPFSSVEEMDETMIENWNAKVKPNDTIYHLGDFSFSKNPQQYFKRLNGRKILIRGNHDGLAIVDLGWDGVHHYYELKVGKQLIVLFHYGMRVWNGSHHGSWHLYGHSHGKLPSSGLSFDAGVDCHNFSPISYDEVKIKMESLKNNEENMKQSPDYELLSE